MPRALSLVLVLHAALSTAHAGGLTPTYLRCEYREAPLGIDVARPRLSWLLTSAERDQVQSAYRVLVATSAEQLDADRGDLWDSGKVQSDETAAVVFAGKPLAPHRQCWWKVRVWDGANRESAWSAPARWSMGYLNEKWQSEWIGFDRHRAAPAVEADFGPAKWIWHAADPRQSAPKGNRLFIRRLELPDAAIQKAQLVITADDKYRLLINGRMAAVMGPGDGGFKRARVADIAMHLKPGSNDFRAEVENAAEGPAGFIARISILTADGQSVDIGTDAEWKSGKPMPNWHKVEIDTAAWPAAAVVGSHGDQPWGKASRIDVQTPPPAYLRTDFQAGKPLRSAMLYVTALGIADVYINGRRTSEDWFNPGWTDYAKRVYYRAYDVTRLVRPGQNALGAILADGWYSGHIGWGNIRDHYGKKPRLRAELRLVYDDGSVEVVGTTRRWKAATGGTLSADYLMGETHDARKEPRGWAAAGFDDGGWQTVDAGAEMSPVLQAHPAPPVVSFAEFRARSRTEPKPGVYVLDLGQNFAGVARLKLSGQPGQKVTLRFAERLNPDGTIYTTNLRSARATDTYICAGGGEETWTPRFTFHGFQYVEVTGLDAPPAADAVVGVAISSDTPAAGFFRSSEAMLNQLHNNIYFTQRANFIDIPTDCPQRDERLGWTGDAQVYIGTAALNTDVQAFFTKWLVDLEDGQREDGQFPCVAPVKVASADGGPAWADAGTICPWTTYTVYGDRRVLERHYPAMKRFIAFCEGRSTKDLLPPAKYHCFGDWLSIQAETPKDVIYTAYFAYSTQLTARAAEVLGHRDDAATYSQLFDRIKRAFCTAYVQPDGSIKGDTQACYVLALAFDLLPADQRAKAAKRLVDDIAARDGHLSTGFIGTKDLMLVLAKIGRNDVAYRLLHNETFPSWGFSIRHGATSIWERWDGWTPDKGFQDPGMNSFAHYSFGAVYQWMVENIGGIRSEGPGYKRVVLAPQPGGKLAWAEVGYRGIRGRIESKWKRQGDRLLVEFSLPPNTTAAVVLPADPTKISEGGKPLAAAAGVRNIAAADGRATFELGSGDYRLEMPAPPR